MLCGIDVGYLGDFKTPSFAGSGKCYPKMPLPPPRSQLADGKVLRKSIRDKVLRPDKNYHSKIEFRAASTANKS